MLKLNIFFLMLKWLYNGNIGFTVTFLSGPVKSLSGDKFYVFSFYVSKK